MIAAAEPQYRLVGRVFEMPVDRHLQASHDGHCVQRLWRRRRLRPRHHLVEQPPDIPTPPEHSITRISSVAVASTLTIPELTGIIRKAEKAAQG